MTTCITQRVHFDAPSRELALLDRQRADLPALTLSRGLRCQAPNRAGKLGQRASRSRRVGRGDHAPRAGAGQQFRFPVHPIALGRGLPLFNELSSPLNLSLVDAKAFGSGTMAHVCRNTAAPALDGSRSNLNCPYAPPWPHTDDDRLDGVLSGTRRLPSIASKIAGRIRQSDGKRLSRDRRCCAGDIRRLGDAQLAHCCRQTGARGWGLVSRRSKSSISTPVAKRSSIPHLCRTLVQLAPPRASCVARPQLLRLRGKPVTFLGDLADTRGGLSSRGA